MIALSLATAAEPAAVAPSAEPLTTLPTDVRLLVRFADGTRANSRWLASPYPTLLATAWGTPLRDHARNQPGPFQLLSRLALAQRAVLGLNLVDSQPVGHLLATATDAAAADALAAALVSQPTAAAATPDSATVTVVDRSAVRATIPLANARLDGVFRPRAPGISGGVRWSWDELLPLPATVIDAPLTATVDADIHWLSKAPWPDAAADATIALRAEWELTTYGLHERLQIAGLPKPASGAPTSADRAAFTGLPPDTLWAVASAQLPALLAQVPGLTPADRDAWLAKKSLPPWEVISPKLGGALLWLQQGAPLPAVSLTVTMPQELGTAALAWLDAEHQFSPGSDGTHLGAVGFVPLQAAWRDGNLIITTSPGGIAGASARPGGFTADPAVAEALKALPAGDLLLAGVSRSGESWGGLAAFAPWLTRRKPELATLGTDLRKAGKYGFIGIRRDGEPLVIDAGGLFGGPLAMTMITGGFFRATLGERERQGGERGGDRPPRQRARDAGKDDTPPPTKQVEF